MAHARIDSPEVIKDFRNHFVKFNEACRQSLASLRSDIYRVQQWLHSEQLNHWKNELRRAEDRVQQARLEYSTARHATPGLQKGSCLDELKALRRAEARKEEAMRKIQTLKKWALTLDQQILKLMGPVNQLSLNLDVESPKALARLENMIQNLEEYLRTTPPDAGA